MSSIALDPKVTCNHDTFPRDGFDEELMELLMIFAEEDTSESSMDAMESTPMHTVNDLSKVLHTNSLPIRMIRPIPN